jgi:hypothetical protein
VSDFKEVDFIEPSADSFPIPSLFGHSALQVGSQMVVVGGKAFNSSSTEIYVFDLGTRPSLFLARTSPHAPPQPTSPHFSLVIAVAHACIADHRTWKRQETSANPENYLPRYYHACCVFGSNKILMFGGTHDPPPPIHRHLWLTGWVPLSAGYDLTWGSQNDMAILETGPRPPLKLARATVMAVLYGEGPVVRAMQAS